MHSPNYNRHAVTCSQAYDDLWSNMSNSSTLDLQKTHVSSALVSFAIGQCGSNRNKGWVKSVKVENEQNEWKSITLNELIVFQRRRTQNSSFITFTIFISFLSHRWKVIAFSTLRPFYFRNVRKTSQRQNKSICIFSLQIIVNKWFFGWKRGNMQHLKFALTAN